MITCVTAAQAFDDLNTKACNDQRVTNAGKNSGQYRNFFTFIRIRCQIWNNGPIRNIHDCVSHTPKDINCRNIYTQCYTGQMQICKYCNKYKRINQCTDDQPGNEFTPTASCIIYNHTHNQVIECVPQLCYEEHCTNKCRRYLNDICKINHGKGCNHPVDQVLTQCTEGKCIFDSAWYFSLVYHTTFFVCLHFDSLQFVLRFFTFFCVFFYIFFTFAVFLL